MNIGLEILIIFALIILNGVFALSEIAVLSSRKARLQQRINEGDKGADTALRLAENPNIFLSTTQVGITLIGVLAGAVGGATISDALASQFELVPALQPYAHSLALGIVVVLITFFSLLLGELVPKRLALHSPEDIASAIAGPMNVISRLFSPLVRLLSGLTDLVMRLLGVKPSDEPPVTEEELQVLLDQGTQAGVFEESEQDMVEGVFRLNDRRVGSLMTPRSEIAWLDVNDTPDEIRLQIEENPYSRFPVCEDSLDNVIGVIEARAARLGCPLLVHGQHWRAWEERGRLVFQDENGLLDLPLPNLPGPHQIDNAATAIAVVERLRAAGLRIDDASIRKGLATVDWPARLQPLVRGPLVDAMPPGCELWLDGGHNEDCGLVLAEQARVWAREPGALPLYLIFGMLTTKDAGGFLRPLARHATGAWAVPVEGHASYTPAEACRRADDVGLQCLPAPSVADALEAGMIWLNSENVRHLPTPFGGMKSSGIGRDGGDYSFDFYMETKHVSLARGTHKIQKLGM